MASAITLSRTSRSAPPNREVGWRVWTFDDDVKSPAERIAVEVLPQLFQVGCLDFMPPATIVSRESSRRVCHYSVGEALRPSGNYAETSRTTERGEPIKK